MSNMDDVKYWAETVQEAIRNYDVREKPLTSDNIQIYTEYVISLNEMLLSTNELKETFVDWVGNHMRNIFNEDTTIHINKVGSEIIIRSTSFDDAVFIKLNSLGLKYHIFHFNEYMQINVELF